MAHQNPCHSDDSEGCSYLCSRRPGRHFEEGENRRNIVRLDAILLIFFLVSRKPPTKDQTSESLTTVIKRQTRCFMDTFEVPKLPPCNAQRSTRDMPPCKDSLPESEAAMCKLKKLVASKIADGDIKAAVRAVAGGDDLAPDSTDTIEALRSKHPDSPADLKMTELPEAAPSEGHDPQLSLARLRSSFTQGIA